MTAGNSKTKIVLHHSPDKGWAWVVAFACCFINAIIFGIFRTYGVIFVALLNTYDVSRETASWPFSLCLTVFHMTGLISGALSTYFSTRSICMAGCLIASLGISLCYFTTSVLQVGILIGFFKGFGMGLVGTQTPVIINQYFVKYRATATGIALAGGTLGSFIFPPLVKHIIVEYSLHGCFLILGGITLNTIPVALLLRPPVPKIDFDSLPRPLPIQQQVFTVISTDQGAKNEDCSLALTFKVAEPESDGWFAKISKPVATFVDALAENAKLIRSLISNPLFLVLCSTQIAFTWGWTTYVMVVVDFAVDQDIDISVAVTLLSAFAGADFCGRLGSGWISDKGLVKRRNVAVTAILMIGILLFSLPYLPNFPILFSASLLLGLFSGSIMILFSILLVEYVGIEKMPVALGTSTFTCGMATMLRPSVIGFFRDAHDSYNGLFSFMAALCILSASLWAIEPCINYCKNKKSNPIKTPAVPC